MNRPLYRYEPGTGGTDGTENTFDVYGPTGRLVSVPYWEAKVEAEATARLITDALNAYGKTMTRLPAWLDGGDTSHFGYEP